jgi:hypothetical protein
MGNLKNKLPTLSRREALKILAATTGAVALSNLPSRWETPLIESGQLPAHAQASPAPTPTATPVTAPPLGTGDLQATLRWNTGNPAAVNCSVDSGASGGVDIDLHVVEPGGTRVFFGNTTGPTAQLDADNQVAFGPENIFVQPGQAAAGTYTVQVVYFCGLANTNASVAITVFANTPQEQSVTFNRNLTTADPTVGINVAEITFPAGTIVEIAGTVPIPVVRGAEKG